MKALLIVSLLVFGACSAKSKKEKCTYNGQNIPCKDMPAKNSDSITGDAVGVKLDMEIEIQNGTSFEVRETNFARTQMTVNNVTLNCGMSFTRGDRGTYSDTYSELTLQNQIYSFKKISGRRSGLIGKWESFEENYDMKIKTVWSFSKNKLSIDRTCTAL